MTGITPKQADQAIQTGQQVEFQTIHGERVQFTITSRDGRVVRGAYVFNGKVQIGAFELSSLTLA